MAQIQLFELPPPEPPAWRRLSDAKQGTIHQRWLHVPSGIEVKHCGHPTANWPYYASDPSETDVMLLDANGRGWQRLELAKRAVERHHAGRLVKSEREPWKACDVRRLVEPGE